MFDVRGILSRALSRPRPLDGFGRLSYAQSGEDIIIDVVMRELGIEAPIYLDIGANHPVHISNTYLSYKNGSRGVLVEPDPSLVPALEEARPGDTVLNVGVAASSGDADFYVMSPHSLNTFSKEEAERYASGSHRIEKVLRLPVVGINELLERHGCPNFVSPDVEGLDFEILSAWDFERFRPELFVVETATYTETRGSERKRPEIFELMESKGYLDYADTHFNTVFVDRRVWVKQ